MLSERRASFRPQPKQTVAYQVQPSDTLEGIAIRYDITPSELAVLNKLCSRTVFPGQTIYIPEKNSLQVFEQIIKDGAAALASSSEQSSPKPGHVERIPGDDPKDRIVPDVDFKEAIAAGGARESLRINSKYVTDGEGVVSGVLIVTANHVIFDPNVSDPLVVEYGLEKYGVEAPMPCIVRAALYTDIFRMKIKDSSNGDSNVNVYHSKNLNIKKSKSQTDKLGKSDKPKRRYSSVEVGPTRQREFGVPFSNSFQENLSKICEATDPDDEDSVPPNNDNSTMDPTSNDDIESAMSPTNRMENEPWTNNDNIESAMSPTNNDNIESAMNQSDMEGSKKYTVQSILTSSSSFESEDGVTSRKASISDDDVLIAISDSPKKKSGFEKTKNKLHKGFKKLSLTDGLFSNPSGGRRMSLPAFSSLPDFKSSKAAKSSPTDKESKIDSEKFTSGSAVYVNMVDEKPELFAPLDKLIPRPAKSFCDTPLYLCLRMGQPVEKSLKSTSPVIHFGHKMKSEYWFSIPKDSVDNLYFFFLRWCPAKYGDIDKMDLEAMGFTPVDPPEESEEEEPPKSSGGGVRRASWAFPWRRKSKDEPSSAPEGWDVSWEFLDFLGAKSDTVHPPELLTPSDILNDEQLLQINKHLPARAMNPWELIYGTTVHGFSLKTMYRAMTHYDCPVLIVVVNRNDAMFGAFLSSPLKMSDHFYGTGESFLFTFYPEFKVFRWSGENDYFIKGNTNSFFIGSSEGQFGLWLDDDLFRGRTNACQTFSSRPLCPEEDFEVKSLEAWGFV